MASSFFFSFQKEVFDRYCHFDRREKFYIDAWLKISRRFIPRNDNFASFFKKLLTLPRYINSPLSKHQREIKKGIR